MSTDTGRGWIMAPANIWHDKEVSFDSEIRAAGFSTDGLHPHAGGSQGTLRTGRWQVARRLRSSHVTNRYVTQICLDGPSGRLKHSCWIW